MLTNPELIPQEFGSFIKSEALYKGNVDEEVKASFRIIQAASAEKTLLASTLVIPAANNYKETHFSKAEWLNQYKYTSGMNANTIGDHVQRLIDQAGGDYYVIENDFSSYDAS